VTTYALFLATNTDVDGNMWAELASAPALRLIPHDPSILAGLAHGEETAQAPPFQAVLTATLEAPAELEARLARVPWLDRARSRVVAGAEYVVVEGDQPIVLAMALTRRPELSHDDFVRHWSTTHADLGRQVPGSEGYRQLHLDPERTAEARAALGFGGPEFDGVALAYYSSRDAVIAILANAEVTASLLEDERRFIDHSQAAMVIGATV
jgi:EthD domain